ncbi:DNA polymerase III subunit delta [Rhabdothermincola salaria]|uniref:DNA polymerase III subunit delta n=1 Tax=Rhabdothermincola salaria TaxID=2903142 RepID=UPI001E342005|nr:DNA polymerase III subunit delta [Rhabdothermincola salaria]MCD9622680.1 DNA polymerase III subunit delta [Rhabdothermincola salaria]
MNVDLSAPVYLVKGADEVLLGDAVVDLVRALVGDGDRSLMVEELTADAYDGDEGMDIAPLVDAAQTSPFLTERRVVVARHAGVFSTKDAVAPLVGYLADPLPTTSLVLVWEKDTRPNKQGRLANVPRSLSDAVTTAGGVVVDTAPGTGKARASWVDEHLRDASVTLDNPARAALVTHLGDEANRLPGLLSTLEGVFGPGARLGVDQVMPYLGEAGDVAPWDLTDAIDAGDVPKALDQLHRMLAGGGRHPLQVMATLTNHVVRMVRLDDPTIRGEKAAAEALGIKGSTFPAKKALAGAQRLGSERLAELVGLVAQADLDLHGAKAWPPELVVEVLVARLAGRSRAATRR